jgi:hypothetical protein
VIVRPITTPVSVPRVALHQDEKGGPQVFVYSPTERRVHARHVELGARRSGDVDIANGLQAGEMIVVGSRELLADGVVVQPINAPIVVTAVVRSRNEPYKTAEGSAPKPAVGGGQ